MIILDIFPNFFHSIIFRRKNICYIYYKLLIITVKKNDKFNKNLITNLPNVLLYLEKKFIDKIYILIV